MTSPPTSTPSAEGGRRAGRRRLAIGWGLGLLTSALAAAVAAALVVFGGVYDIRATSPHPEPMAWAIHEAMANSVQLRSGEFTPPPSFSGRQVLAGFTVYDADCVMCHGGPGVAREPWTSGMTPTPPFLLDVGRRFSAQDLRLIVGDGVKMTGMPAWRTVLTEEQLWDVVAFLKALPDLSAADYRNMRAAAHARTGPRASQG